MCARLAAWVWLLRRRLHHFLLLEERRVLASKRNHERASSPSHAAQARTAGRCPCEAAVSVRMVLCAGKWVLYKP